jgi:hypothetical protein
MRDSLNGGSLFSMTLADTTAYGKKIAYGMKRLVMLLLWAAPLIACIVIARINMAGETDGFTVLRMIKRFGGGDLMTGMLYLVLILIASILLFAFGCAFHSGARHAWAQGDRTRVQGHHGKILLAWLASLVCVLPMAAAVVWALGRYVPVLQDLNGLLMRTVKLPSLRETEIILAAGAVLTLPLLPLRSLIPAAAVEGLED